MNTSSTTRSASCPAAISSGADAAAPAPAPSGAADGAADCPQCMRVATCSKDGLKQCAAHTVDAVPAAASPPSGGAGGSGSGSGSAPAALHRCTQCMRQAAATDPMPPTPNCSDCALYASALALPPPPPPHRGLERMPCMSWSEDALPPPPSGGLERLPSMYPTGLQRTPWTTPPDGWVSFPMDPDPEITAAVLSAPPPVVHVERGLVRTLSHSAAPPPPPPTGELERLPS